jgi:hypothetical protein
VQHGEHCGELHAEPMLCTAGDWMTSVTAGFAGATGGVAGGCMLVGRAMVFRGTTMPGISSGMSDNSPEASSLLTEVW